MQNVLVVVVTPKTVSLTYSVAPALVVVAVAVTVFSKLIILLVHCRSTIVVVSVINFVLTSGL